MEDLDMIQGKKPASSIAAKLPRRKWRSRGFLRKKDTPTCRAKDRDKQKKTGCATTTMRFGEKRSRSLQATTEKKKING